MTRLAMAVVVCVCSTLHAADEAVIEAARAAGKRDLLDQIGTIGGDIARAEDKLAEMKKSRSYGTAKKKKDAIAAAHARIAGMKAEGKRLQATFDDENAFIVPKIDLDLEIGEVGILCYDGQNPVRGKVIQVVDAQNAIIMWSSRMHWVKMPTAGLVDDQMVEMRWPVHVKGTKQYTSALGTTNTVYEIHVVDLTEQAEQAGRP